MCKTKVGDNVSNELDIKSVIGQGYDEFWRSTKRYVVCKGSRASKKSTTAALKLIVRLMQYPLANALVVRQTASTLKDSCYAQLKWAINRLGVGVFWKCTVNPLQMTYLPTGQKILFKGLDDSLKITSITVDKGHSRANNRISFNVLAKSFFYRKFSLSNINFAID